MCHQTTTSHYLARVSYSSKPCRCHTHLHGQSAATYNYATFHSKLKVQAFFIIFIFYLSRVPSFALFGLLCRQQGGQ